MVVFESPTWSGSMSINQPQSTWWRRVPRSRTVGVVRLIAYLVAFGLTLYALLSGIYTTPLGITLETVVVILLAWCALQQAFGLAALRR
jgi:hypothetical protein